MSYTRQSVIDAYKKTGDMKATCQITGCKPYKAFVLLKTAGVMRAHDKRGYGTIHSKRGAEAEQEFKRLVPDALPMNEEIRENHPVYDFDINGVKVDVKYSGLIGRRKNGQGQLQRAGEWVFKTAAYLKKAAHPDFYVAFLALDGEKGIAGGYKVLCIPDELVATQGAIHISKAKNAKTPWLDFEIAPEALADFFNDKDLIACIRQAGELQAEIKNVKKHNKRAA